MKPSGSRWNLRLSLRETLPGGELLLSLLADRGERFTHSLGATPLKRSLEVRDRLISLHKVTRNDRGRLAAVDFHKGERHRVARQLKDARIRCLHRGREGEGDALRTVNRLDAVGTAVSGVFEVLWQKTVPVFTE